MRDLATCGEMNRENVRVVVGLGNVGSAYYRSRHNVGFMVLDRLNSLSKPHGGIDFSQERLAFTSTLQVKGRCIKLTKPTTYMNMSGRSVRYWKKKEGVEMHNMLIIADDISLPLGRLRMRAKGSNGGHNGLRSVEEYLCTSTYPRLRFGVGNHFAKGRQSAYVLQDFLEEEQEQLEKALEKAQEMVLSFCLQGIEKTMSLYNQQ